MKKHLFNLCCITLLLQTTYANTSHSDLSETHRVYSELSVYKPNSHSNAEGSIPDYLRVLNQPLPNANNAFFFSSTCPAITPNYNEDFSTFLDGCWSELDGPVTGPSPSSTSSHWQGDDFLNTSSLGKSARVNLYTNTRKEWLLSPVFDLSAGGYEVKLDVGVTDYYGSSSDNMGSDDYVNLMQSLDNGSTWSSIYTWNLSNQPSNTGETITVNISSVSSTETQFAIFATDGSIDDSEDYNFYVDNFIVRTIPSCLENTDLLVPSVSSTTANVMWTSPGTATNWQLEYGIEGFTQGTGSYQIASDTVSNLTGLDLNTDYDVYVRSICGVGDSSVWIGPASFTTLCGIFTPNYSEDFATFLDVCWSQSQGPLSGPDLSGTTSSWLGGNYLNTSSLGKSAKVNLYNTSHNDWLITPEFNLSAGGYEINLDVGITAYSGTSSSDMGSDDTVRIMQTLDGGISWTEIYNWTLANQPNNSGNNMSLDISGLTNVNAQFAVYATDGLVSDSEDYYFYIDNFKVRTIPTCIENTALNLTGILSNAARIQWTSPGTATAWEVEFGEDGFTQGTGTIETATDTNYLIENLQSSTEYQAYVRAVCGVGNSSEWLGPIDFTTLCSGVTPYYIEDFTVFLDACWSESEGPLSGPNFYDETSTWESRNYLNTASLGKGVKLNLFNTNHDEWLLSPEFDLSAGGYEININAGVTNYNNSSPDVMGSDDSVRIMQTLDGGYTWTMIHSWSLANQPSHLGEVRILDISALTSSNARFAIYATDGPVDDSEDYDFYIDRFVIRTIPTCLENTNLNVSNILSTTADVQWTSPGLATTWQLEYGESGFTPGTGTFETVADTTYTIENLLALTEYEVYVRGICNAGDSSEWIGPNSFTTLCEAVTPYYIEEYTTFLNACWSEFTGDVSGTDLTLANSSWASDDYLNTSSLGKSAKINLFSNTKEEWLVSPLFDLSTGGYQIALDVGVTTVYSTTASSMGSDDEVHLMQSLDGGLNWTSIYIWNSTNQPSELGYKAFIDISTITNTNVKFAIYATDGSVDDTENYNFYVDNFVVRTLPSCPENTNFTASEIGSDSAQLIWNSPSSATEWQLEYGLEGFTQGSGQYELVSDTNYTLQNLTYNTDYDVYIRSICSVGDSSAWTGPIGFTTICGAIVPNYEEDFTTYLNGCWSESEGPLSGPDVSDVISYWFGGNYLNTPGTNKAAKINLFTTNRDEWLMSPVFNLSAGGYELGLDVAVTNYNSSGPDVMGSDDSVRIMESINGGASWTMLYSWSLANQPAHTGEHITLDISALTEPQVQFAIFATDGPVDDSEDYDFFVDNFSIIHNPCLNAVSNTTHQYTGCESDGYSVTVGSSVYNETNLSGVDTILNAFGCDSIVSTQLTFNPVYAVNHLYTGCEGDGYAIIIGSNLYNESNTSGTDTLASITGCDSVVTTQLIFNSETAFTITDTTCTGLIEINEQTYTTSGIYTQTLTNALGCDSTLTLQLVINEPTSETIENSTCSGQINYNGIEYTSTGVYTQTLLNSVGCDSVLTLDLVIGTVDSVTYTQSTCNDTLVINNETFTESGLYEQVLSDVTGCDSVVTLDLEFGVGTFGMLTQLVCEDSIVINNTTYTSTGVYSQTIPLSAVCDSTLELHLTFVEPTSYQIVDSMCMGPFEFNGVLYTTSGVYTQILTNTNGCDSVLTLDLVIHQSSQETVADTTCAGLLIYNGVEYTSTGQYTQTLTNTKGCDSVLTLDLVIHEESNETLTETSCLGVLTFNGVDYTTTGVYTQMLTNAVGCDSTLTLNLNINVPTAYTLYDTTCAGTLTFNSEIFTASGTYTQTLTNAADCDSVLTLALVIKEHSTETITQTTCLGILEFNGITYTTSGVYTQDLINVAGCDSTLTLNLTIGETTNGVYTETTCDGELEINGTVYTSSGVYQQTLTNAMNCDSLLTLNLTILEGSTGVYNETTCADEITVNSIVYTNSGVYIQTLTNAVGCDSIVTLNLVMDLTSPITNSYQLICSSEVDINGEVYTNSGIYQQDLTNAYGCDSLVNYHLNFSEGDSVFVDTVVCGQNAFEYQGFLMYSSGHYEFTLEQASACPTILLIDIEFVDEFAVDITQNGTNLICNQTSGDFQWFDCNTGLAGEGETNPTFQPQINGEFYVEVTQNGCTYRSDCFTSFGIGLEETEISGFNLYPNPNKGQFSVRLNALGIYKSWRITTALGQIFTEKEIKMDVLEFKLELNLTPGVYYLQLLSETQEWESKALIIE